MIEHALVCDDAEVPEPCRQLRLRDALDDPGLPQPICHQLRDRDETEIVLEREFFQISSAGHRAVFIQDLTDDADCG